ncbi:hypothetical protein N9L68_03030 [bacterium]|nr:hypothetical protein [bacterium]
MMMMMIHDDGDDVAYRIARPQHDDEDDHPVACQIGMAHYDDDDDVSDGMTQHDDDGDGALR